MKTKHYILGLILTSLVGYLEWGEGQHQFVFEVLGTLFTQLLEDPASVLHPLTVLPFLGLVLWIIAFIQLTPSKRLVYAGIILMGLLFAMLVVVGVLGSHWKILVATIPFWGMVVFTIRHFRKMKKKANQ